MLKNMFDKITLDGDGSIVDNIKDIIVDSEGVLESFPTKMAKLKPGQIQCKECGKIYRSITGNHLATHNMTLKQYATKYPGVEINYFGNRFPDAKDLPDFQFKSGKTKDRVKPEKSKAVVETTSKKKSVLPSLPPASERNLTTIESYVRKAIGNNGESVIQFLHNVILYDQKKAKDKFPLYKPSEQIKAADMLLGYGFGRPTQRQDINKNVKQVTINVSAKMPEDLDPEDF